MQKEWEEIEGFLTKEFHFLNFKEALSFVNRVGEIAERMEHHPDISIKNYNQVVIATMTHDAGSSITEKDHALAAAIDALQ